MTTSLKITVIMPAFNAGKYIAKAINSILSQTLDDLELIVINDGSTDDTFDLIKSFNDPRIILIENETNIGIIQSSNKGLKLARGQYIALMDSDDISMPRRLEKQAYFLDTNHDIAACGSWARIFGSVFGVAKTLTDSEELAATFVFENMVINSSAMVRRDVLEREKLKYRDEFPHAHDYDLWARLSLSYKLYNLDEVLVKYRVHQSQDSQKSAKLQRESALRIKKYLLLSYGFSATEKDLAAHKCLTSYGVRLSEKTIDEVEQWLIKLTGENEKIGKFNQDKFRSIIEKYWKNFCIRDGNFGLTSFRRCIKSPLYLDKKSDLGIFSLLILSFVYSAIIQLKRIKN